MAKQNVQTNEQQQQESRGTQVARNSPGGQLANRGRSSQFGLSLSPFELFLTNPFSVMRRMTDEMDRAFAEFSGSNGDANLWTPAIEVSQRDGQFVVQAELPGLKPEDVKVEVADDALVIEGERKCEREEDQGGVHRTERRYGRFYRLIPLPEGVNAEQARARFENGVLEVDIPVAQQQSDRRQIPVQPSSPSVGSAGTSSGTASAGSSNESSGSSGKAA
jgi:HSP20 family protein